VSNCLKGASGRVIVHEKGIKDSRKEYMEKLIKKYMFHHTKLIALILMFNVPLDTE